MMTRIHVASDDCVIFLIFLCSFQIQTYAIGHCKDKYRVFPEHSACLPKSPKATPGQVNSTDALAVHNRYRQKAAQKYKTTDMLKMVWDNEVAMVAQKWAENCDISHDGNYQRLIPGRFSVGQNIAGGKSQLSWETVVQLFYSESKDFTLGSKHNQLGKVGHFTQLTWADSYILGCGYAVCDGHHFYVCNYAPSIDYGETVARLKDIEHNLKAKPNIAEHYNGKLCGNHAGELGNPFETNDTAQTDLIDCQQKICEGGSSLDPATCTCKCPTDYYHKSLNFLKSADNRCQLTCVPNLKEKFFCGSKDYAEKSCLRLSNVPFDCPKTCHICPYADPSYTEGSAAIITLENSSGDARTVTLLIPAFVLLVTFSHCWFHLYTSN